MGALLRRWPGMAIGVHALVVALASWQLAARHATALHYACWATISGVSLFVLTGLVHEASHRLLCRRSWLNEAMGNLSGWIVLTPLSAYRAFHLKHHQTTNGHADPNAPLNSRWMLLFGSPVYVFLIHLHVWRNLRGRSFARYLMETLGMAVLLGVLVVTLPSSWRDRVWLLPLSIVILLQNVRIVTEHLDLPAGRYHDTWQLALPRWLSGWLLHYDHHLEHHLRPGLHWHELPGYRARLATSASATGVHRVTLGQYFWSVILKRPIGSNVTRRSPRRPRRAAWSSDPRTMPPADLPYCEPTRSRTPTQVRRREPALRVRGIMAWTQCAGPRWRSSWCCTPRWLTPSSRFPT